MSALQLPEARVVEPVQDWAALENARLVNEARAQLLTSGTAVTVDAIVDVTGKQPDTVRRWISRARREHRLVTVTHDGQVYIPTVQLTDALDDIDPDVAAVVGMLVDYGMDGWAVWDWFQVANTWLGGDSPADRLAAGDLEAVHRAVAGLTQA